MPVVPVPSNTIAPNNRIRSAEMLSIINAIYNLVNGGLDDANIASLTDAKIVSIAEAKVVFAATGHAHTGASAGVEITSGCWVKGLTGRNNSGTPDTQYDLAADEVVLTNTPGTPIGRRNTGTITNNIALVGPVVNGRDQAGAFGVSTWIHFYFIWNGTTIGTLSSLTAPPTSPTLPGGYTHYAYAGAVRHSATSTLVRTRLRGSMAYYHPRQLALSAGNNATEQTLSLTSIVPPNALDAYLLGTVVSSDAADVNARVRFITGEEFVEVLAINGKGSDSFRVPNVSQQVFWITSGVAGHSLSLYVLGYKVPNGDS